MAYKDPELASLAARVAVNTHLSRLDTAGRAARTAPMREARWAKYLDQVDPDGVMTDSERIQAAQHAMAADMARLSLLAVQARKKKAAQPVGVGST